MKEQNLSDPNFSMKLEKDVIVRKPVYNYRHAGQSPGLKSDVNQI